MILEFPNHVSDKDIDTILSAVHPHVENGQTHVYNRDGKTVNITKTEELKEVDKLLQDIFADVHKSLVSQRYRPIGNQQIKIMNIIGMIKDRFAIIIQMVSLLEMLTKDVYCDMLQSSCILIPLKRVGS
jgi:hypothetical protein